MLRYLNRAHSWLLSHYLNRLPTKAALQILENVSVVDKIDYPDSEIYMVLSTSRELGRLRYWSKEYSSTSLWLENNIDEKSVFYDVGANVGGYSMIASKMGARSFAFEPGFGSFNNMCINIAINNLEDKITPIHTALADKTEFLKFQMANLAPGSAGGGQGLAGTQNLLSEQKSINYKGVHGLPNKTQFVPVYKLDDIIELFGFPLPTLVKIDVDGTEMEVLLGAKRTLCDKNVTTVLCEIGKDNPDLGHRVVSFMTSCGFMLAEPLRTGNNIFVRNS